MIESLANYVMTELFDTEGMEIDLEIEKGGNIEGYIDNKKCIETIKNMFSTAKSLVEIHTLYRFIISITSLLF